MTIGKLILLGIVVVILGGCSTTGEEEVGMVYDEIKIDQPIEVPQQIETTINQVDYSKYFKGVKGGAIFYRASDNSYDVYNDVLCDKKFSPYSTFKIIMTLMGIESGILESKEVKMGYDGTKYWREEWNQDVTLEEAFKTSCVWYYEKVMNLLDKSYVQETLDKLAYGNRDISRWDENGHHKFWLNSTLKVSPREQVDVLVSIFEQNELFKKESIECLKNIMFIEETDTYSIYGKTGAAKDTEAWFVGFLNKEGEKLYFAICIEDDSQTLAGSVAKEIAIELLSEEYI